jgi:hypothetical protein
MIRKRIEPLSPEAKYQVLAGGAAEFYELPSDFLNVTPRRPDVPHGSLAPSEPHISFRVNEFLSFFDDGGLYRGGDPRDQDHFCGRAQVQGGANLVGEHYLRRFYRLGGAVSYVFHGAYFVHEERAEHFGVVTINTA